MEWNARMGGMDGFGIGRLEIEFFADLGSWEIRRFSRVGSWVWNGD
jgi:hypothetical protein